MKAIQQGRGACSPRATGEIRESCGGPTRGKCTTGDVCECKKGWTGPHCLVTDSSDDIIWDPPDNWTDVGFVPPLLFPKGLLIGFVLIVLAFVIALRMKARLKGWTPIPDVDHKF